MTPNACNSIPALTSDALLGEECFVPSSDGGVAPDGGMLQVPVGGTIQDGDYVLVRDQVSADNCFGQDPGPPSRARSVRVFGGGTYFEWVQSDLQGTATQAWWDATGSTSGVIFTFSETCGSATLPATVGFTATSDELTLFFYGNQSFENGPLHIITTYRRTCAR